MSDNGRRRKVVHISPDLLIELLTQGNELHVICDEGLPPDAQFITMGYDYTRDRHYIIFESDTWEPVPNAQALPWFDITLRTVQPE